MYVQPVLISYFKLSAHNHHGEQMKVMKFKPKVTEEFNVSGMGMVVTKL